MEFRLWVESEESASFKAWFGNSKVVDDEGRPLVVFHGSRNPSVMRFDPAKDGSGVVSLSKDKYGGWFFSSSRSNAEWFADYKDLPPELSADEVGVYGDDDDGYYYYVMDEEENVLLNDGPFSDQDQAETEGAKHVELYNRQMQAGRDMFTNAYYLKMENPLIVDKVDRAMSPPMYIPEAKENGHDGVIIRDYHDGAEVADVFIVFNSNQVKSAEWNIGSYNPQSDRFGEARTHGHDLKHVYHWDVESNWNKVLRKQGPGLWVSPNKDWNDHWASVMVSGEEHDRGNRTFYLHTIGMPRDLYNKHAEQGRTAGNRFGPEWGEAKEFVIPPQEWEMLVPVNVKPFKRSDLLKRHFRHLRRRERATGRETGEFATGIHPGSTGKAVTPEELRQWRLDRGEGEE